MPANLYSKITRRPGKGAEKLLGELELEIMRVVWRHESVTVREVSAALSQKRVLAYTTVMTVMNRLAEKGLLLAEKRGKTGHYHAALTRAEFEAQTVGEVVQSLLDDFGGELAISQFVKQLAEADPEQLARLAELARQAQEVSDES